DGVERDGGLAGLAIADDELALAATDGNHRVDRLDASLKRLLHRLADDDAGRLQLDASGGGRLDRSLAVDGLAEGVDDAPELLLVLLDLLADDVADLRRADLHRCVPPGPAASRRPRPSPSSGERAGSSGSHRRPSRRCRAPHPRAALGRDWWRQGYLAGPSGGARAR